MLSDSWVARRSTLDRRQYQMTDQLAKVTPGHTVVGKCIHDPDWLQNQKPATFGNMRYIHD